MLQKKLFFIDILNDKILFFAITLEKNNNEHVLYTSSGKIGNKGVTTVVHKGTDYELYKSEFWKKVAFKKSQGYKEDVCVINKLSELFCLDYRVCDCCGNKIKLDLYEKINHYLRTESDLDNNEKWKYAVLCFACQKKMNIYKFKNKRKE